jgi:hypothetical protein
MDSCAISLVVSLLVPGGEMPAPTAAVIYFMRTAVICRLPEPSQRRLLSELARATSHAIAPPVIIAAMEGCGVLLELLGEWWRREHAAWDWCFVSMDVSMDVS